MKLLGFAVFIIVASKTHWSIRRPPSIPPYFTIEKHVEAATINHPRENARSPDE